MMVKRQNTHNKFVDFSIIKTEFRCKENNKVDKFCVKEDCKFSALCCRSEQCRTCIESHESCYFRQFFFLKKRMQNMFKFENDVSKVLLLIQEQLMQKYLSTQNNSLNKQNLFRIRQGKFSEIFHKIYSEKNIADIQGSDMNILFNKLSLNEVKQRSKKYIQRYRGYTERMLNQLNIYRESIIQQIFAESQKEMVNQRIKYNYIKVQESDQFDQQKEQTFEQTYKRSHHSKSIMQKEQDVFLKQIDSQILIKDEQGRQMLSYLIKELGNPKQLKLLFRASEHEFSAKKFHQFCNNTKRTVSILRTEFNKTLAGYTQNQ